MARKSPKTWLPEGLDAPKIMETAQIKLHQQLEYYQKLKEAWMERVEDPYDETTIMDVQIPMGSALKGEVETLKMLNDLAKRVPPPKARIHIPIENPDFSTSEGRKGVNREVVALVSQGELAPEDAELFLKLVESQQVFDMSEKFDQITAHLKELEKKGDTETFSEDEIVDEGEMAAVAPQWGAGDNPYIEGANTSTPTGPIDGPVTGPAKVKITNNSPFMAKPPKGGK